MINENTAGERIIFTFERLGEDQQFFRILFVKPIAFSDQQVHSLSIPKDNLRPIRSYLTEVLQAGQKYEFSAGANSQLTSEYGHLNWAGRSFEIKLCDQKENLEKDRTTKQNEESSTEEEDDFVVKEIIAFTVRQTFDYPDSFNIRFAEEIQYGKRKVIALSILKTPSGADYQQKLSIFKHDQRFQFLFPVGSMKIKENSNFSETFYLETTFNNLLEIKKLEKEAPAHFSGPSTSQKVRANKATNPTLANQKLAPDNNWFEFSRWLTDKEIDWALDQVVSQLNLPYNQVSKFKILELTQFMFAKETLDSNDPAARFSFPVLLSELTGFNGNLIFIPINNPNFHWSLLVYEKASQTFYHWDTLRGNPNHGYIKPLVGDLLQQLHQNNKVDLEKYLILQDEIKQPNTWDCGIAVIEITRRIMEKYNGGLEGINLGKFDFPQAQINWRSEYENEQTKQMAVEYQTQIQTPPKSNN